jgi:hypothetical protein
MIPSPPFNWAMSLVSNPGVSTFSPAYQIQCRPPVRSKRVSLV